MKLRRPFAPALSICARRRALGFSFRVVTLHNRLDRRIADGSLMDRCRVDPGRSALVIRTTEPLFCLTVVDFQSPLSRQRRKARFDRAADEIKSSRRGAKARSNLRHQAVLEMTRRLFENCIERFSRACFPAAFARAAFFSDIFGVFSSVVFVAPAEGCYPDFFACVTSHFVICCFAARYPARSLFPRDAREMGGRFWASATRI